MDIINGSQGKVNCSSLASYLHNKIPTTIGSRKIVESSGIKVLEAIRHGVRFKPDGVYFKYFDFGEDGYGNRTVFKFDSLYKKDILFCRTRHVYPLRDMNGKEIKYRQPKKSPVRAYFPRVDRPKDWKDTSVPVFITEGEKKAIALAMRGVLAIGLGGVNSYMAPNPENGPRRMLDDLARVGWNGRTVYIVFDYDAKTKAKENGDIARKGLAKLLAKAGARVYLVDLPPGEPDEDDDEPTKQGIDDYLLFRPDLPPTVKTASALIADMRSLSKRFGNQAIPRDTSDIRPKSLKELESEFSSLRPVLIEGLLRKGEIGNIVASTKHGKSFLVHNLAWCVASGRDWLGFPTRKGRVLIVDNELDGGNLRYRLTSVASAMGINRVRDDIDPDVILLRGRGCDVNDLEDVFSRIEPDHYSLVVLDALYRALPDGTNENDNGAMTKVFNQLNAYAVQLGASIVTVHHASKGAQTNKAISDVGSGAGAFSRAVDTHMTIRPHDDPALCVLDAVCRSWPSPRPQTLRFEFPLWSLSDEAPKLRNANASHEESEKRTRIVEMIRDQGRVKQQTLLDNFGGGSAQRLLEKMSKENGPLVRITEGKRVFYELRPAPAGEPTPG